MNAAVHFTSPARAIGRQEWRVGVRDHWSGRVTFYEWRTAGAHDWHDDRAWPSYDGHRTDDGCPRELRDLYLAHHATIRAALDGTHPFQPLPAAVPVERPSLDHNRDGRQRMQADRDAQIVALALASPKRARAAQHDTADCPLFAAGAQGVLL